MVYQAKKAELSGDAMASGNRTGCGVQPTTMRKIASEGRQLSQMDDDMTKSLEKIRQKLIEKESSRECPPNVVVCLSSKKQTKMLSVVYQRLSGQIHNMNKDCEINLTDFETELEDVKSQYMMRTLKTIQNRAAYSSTISKRN